MFIREKLEELAMKAPGRGFRVSSHTDVKWTPIYMVNKDQSRILQSGGDLFDLMSA